MKLFRDMTSILKTNFIDYYFLLDVAFLNLLSFSINNTDVWFKISSYLFTAPHKILIFVQCLSKGIQEFYVTEEVIVNILGQLREVSERFFTC